MTNGFAKIKKLLQDPKITEIMINGPKAVFIEKEGLKSKLDLTFTEEELKNIVDEAFIKVGKSVSYYYPYADVCLEDGSRVNVIIPPLARQGTAITIRKFSQEIQSLDDLLNLGALSERMAKLLIACIRGRLSIIFSGASGTGKTTTLEMLTHYLPEDERVITIEDTAELKVKSQNAVSLETRTADEQDKGGIALQDLIKNSLRMRPDRIIIGEIRGPEALDMIQAMSTGHKGTLAVVHGSSPKEIASRLETLILSSGVKLPIEEIRKMIANNVDIIVHHERFSDGTRRITHISEVREMEQGEVEIQDLFVFKPKGRTDEGKIKGKFASVMKMYPNFFAEFQKLGLLDEKIFSEF